MSENRKLIVFQLVGLNRRIAHHKYVTKYFKDGAIFLTAFTLLWSNILRKKKLKSLKG